MSLVLASTVACRADDSSAELPMGEVGLDVELRIKEGGRWTIMSFTDEENGLWCYLVRHRYADEYESGIACFPLASLPQAPATGQLVPDFIDDGRRVLRLTNEALGIVCLSHRGDLDCHRMKMSMGSDHARPGPDKLDQAPRPAP